MINNIYLDTEYDGFGGRLISLAAVHPDGSYFYEAVKGPQIKNFWVLQHVVPFINKEALTEKEFRSRLELFFLNKPGEYDIYADWPADFEHLCHYLYRDNGMMINIGNVNFKFVRTPPGKPSSRLPHNALEDARALMRWHTGSE